MSFDIYGPATYKDITVGYVDPERGYITGVSICDANHYASLNPGTIFILETRDGVRYLNINEVNALTPDDILPDETAANQSCKGIRGLRPEVDNEIGPPRVEIIGGAGTGALANPIIGNDGSILQVDMVSGGFGYKYPPQVKVVDDSLQGSGAVLRSVIGELPKTEIVFDQEDDFEIYDFSQCGEEPAGYGDRTNPDGAILGPWDPNLYANLKDDPIKREIIQYQEFLQRGQKPWWTTRLETPLSVTFGDRTNRVAHAVSHLAWSDTSLAIGDGPPSAEQIKLMYQYRWGRIASQKEINDWLGTRLSGREIYQSILEHSAKIAGYIPKEKDFGDSFMNRYAISPVPPSNVPGSDFAGRVCTFEWEEDFPFSGEYVFRGMADNQAVLYLDNEPLIETSNFRGGPTDTLKKTIESGVHRIKIDLLNHPIKEKIRIKKAPPQIQSQNRAEELLISYRGMSEGSGIVLISPTEVGIDDDIKPSFDKNASFKILSSTVNARFSSDGKKLLYNGSGKITIEMKYDDRQNISGLAITDIEVGGTVWAREFTSISLGRGGSGGREKRYKKSGKVVQTIDVVGVTATQQSPAQQPSQPSIESEKFGSVFNTIDYIKKADRKLWRTNVFSKGGFLNEYGVCPFDTVNALDDNPYAGHHDIVWNDVEFPVTGNYNIEVDVDDACNLYFDNFVDEQQSIRKEGFVPNTNTATGKTTETLFFNKGKYRIFADLYQKPGGRFSFDPSSGTKGGKLIPRFRRDANGQIIMFVDGSGSAEIDFSLKVDDRPNISGLALSSVKIGNLELKRTRRYNASGKSRFQRGEDYLDPQRKETISGSGVFEGGISYPVQVIGGSADSGQTVEDNVIRFDDDISGGFDTNAELFIVRVKNEQAAPVKGINPMALAVNITVSDFEREIISAKSWNINPMGAAFTIDAPDPPIPQEPIPEGEGRCPKNPIWTTRFPGASESWYPVTLDKRWSRFMNRFALSPIAPLNTPNSDGGGGVTYRTSWNFEAPYRGFYALKGAVDNGGRILVDNQEIMSGGLNRPRNGLAGFKDPAPQFKKFFLPEGNHTITVEVENGNQTKYKTIIKKVFSTQDFQFPLKKRTLADAPPGGIFLKEGGRYVYLAGGNDIIETDFVLDYDDRTNIAGLAIDNIIIQTEKGDLYFDRDNSRRRGTVKLTGTFKSGNRYAVQLNGRAAGSADPTIVDTGPQPEARQQRINLFDADGLDVNASFTAITSRQLSPPREITETSEITNKDGVVYDGPPIFHYKDKRWSTFMNKNSISPFLPPLDSPNAAINGRREYIFSNVKFPDSGQYTVRLQADNQAEVFINEVKVASAVYDRGTPIPSYVNLTAGTYTVRVSMENTPDYTNIFYSNPVGFALRIDIPAQVATGSPAWTVNPVGISAVLVPPPCPKIVEGKGVVTAIISEEPGNGFPNTIPSPPSDDTPTYPVTLKLKAIVPTSPGINYSPGDPVLVNGEPLVIGDVPVTPNLGPFGEVIDIPIPDSPIVSDDPDDPDDVEDPDDVTDPGTTPEDDALRRPKARGKRYTDLASGLRDISGVTDLRKLDTIIERTEVAPNINAPIGFTEFPDISIPSLTGVGFRGRPVFEPIRVPDNILPDENIIQVTDLVGLKQTGYVNGKPYYGSTFFKDGIRYAGIYETLGVLVQVYSTLEESIEAEVFTRPSAIQRQGTDRSSNDPRLDIPNTPDNLI